MKNYKHVSVITFIIGLIAWLPALSWTLWAAITKLQMGKIFAGIIGIVYLVIMLLILVFGFVEVKNETLNLYELDD